MTTARICIGATMMALVGVALWWSMPKPPPPTPEEIAAREEARVAEAARAQARKAAYEAGFHAGWTGGVTFVALGGSVPEKWRLDEMAKASAGNTSEHKPEIESFEMGYRVGFKEAVKKATTKAW